MAITEIRGLHHVTSMAKDARTNNAFFTDTLGLRRVKQTVNFDAPDIYHLYYGDERGTPGSVMTYFPFPNIAPGKRGVGEVGTTAFSVPKGSLAFWQDMLTRKGLTNLEREQSFGEERLVFHGPDQDGFALVEVEDDRREPWARGAVSADHAIRGFHSAKICVADQGATAELLTFMGYEKMENADDTARFTINGEGAVAHILDVQTLPNAPLSRQGAGSVHHVAFAVDDREAQLSVRKQLLDTGYQVTPVIDRDYFWAIYFRTPGGVLFEVATNEPGFDRDESVDDLGGTLKLPTQHAHLREKLAELLPPLD